MNQTLVIAQKGFTMLLAPATLPLPSDSGANANTSWLLGGAK